VDKIFEDITGVTYLGISLDCVTIHLHYPPDKVSSGATGDRVLVANHDPGIITATLAHDSDGLKQLSKRKLVSRGHALDGTLEILAKEGPYVFDDALMIDLDERRGICRFNIGR
jgi:hypothetical protein